MVQVKMNLYHSSPVHNLISIENIKDENITNNYSVTHTHISIRKWQWKKFQLAVVYMYIIIFDMLRILTGKVNSAIFCLPWFEKFLKNMHVLFHGKNTCFHQPPQT